MTTSKAKKLPRILSYRIDLRNPRYLIVEAADLPGLKVSRERIDLAVEVARRHLYKPVYLLSCFSSVTGKEKIIEFRFNTLMSPLEQLGAQADTENSDDSVAR